MNVVSSSSLENPSPAQPLTNSKLRDQATTLAWLLIIGITLFRLWYITKLGMVADETYYWLWSKHLAAAYEDKGPVIAWMIAAGTRVFGDTPFGIRWLGVLMSAGIGWQIFRLARRLYDERVALWSLVVALVIPLFAVGSVIMTIDTPSVFCWAWAANMFLTALESGRIRHWFALGLIIGAGFLAKFTNGVQLVCIALFLCWSASHRRFVFSRQSIAMVVAFILCCVPLFWWNFHHDWLEVAALHSRSGVKSSFHIHPNQLIKFLGLEIGVLSPLIGVGMVVAAVGLFLRNRTETRVRFLLCQFAPIFGLFCFFSLNSAGKANWPAPGIIGGIVLLVAFWREVARRRPAWRWANGAALTLAGLMTIGLHLATFMSIPVVNKLMNRSEGWPSYAAHIERAQKKYHATLLIADHYATISLAQFYMPNHPRVYSPTGWHPQFDLWGSYHLKPGEHALFITTDNNPNAGKQFPLNKQFKDAVQVDDFYTQQQGRKIKRFHIYYLVAR